MESSKGPHFWKDPFFHGSKSHVSTIFGEIAFFGPCWALGDWGRILLSFCCPSWCFCVHRRVVKRHYHWVWEAAEMRHRWQDLDDFELWSHQNLVNDPEANSRDFADPVLNFLQNLANSFDLLNFAWIMDFDFSSCHQHLEVRPFLWLGHFPATNSKLGQYFSDGWSLVCHHFQICQCSSWGPGLISWTPIYRCSKNFHLSACSFSAEPLKFDHFGSWSSGHLGFLQKSLSVAAVGSPGSISQRSCVLRQHGTFGQGVENSQVFEYFVIFCRKIRSSLSLDLTY